MNVAVAGEAKDATFTVDMTTKSIPLELTTSLRLLTLLTVYGGMGIDWQLGGGSSMELDIKGLSLSGQINNVPYTNLGTADVSASAKASPSSAKMRGILGAQINLAIVRLFAQVNVANTSPTMASLAVGARIAY